MNALIISFGDYDYDGRLRELYALFTGCFETDLMCRAKHSKDKPTYLIEEDSYIKFLFYFSKYKKRMHHYDVLIVDNRKAILPSNKLKKKIAPFKTILDCRELYLLREVKSFSSKLGCIFEKKAIKKADLVICANEARANFMVEYFKLSKKPIVFENVRRLSFDSDYDERKMFKKFPFVQNDEYRIISTSGCSVFRTDNILVENIDKVKSTKRIRLILAGDSTEKDRAVINKIIAEKKLENVIILGRLNQNEMKFLFNHCHVGIVNYSQVDTNNKYCASGKLYEYVYEGLPIVTTTNPPLKEICDKYHIGISDDLFFEGISRVLKEFDLYKTNVERFISNHSVEDNNSKTRRELMEWIGEIALQQTK